MINKVKKRMNRYSVEDQMERYGITREEAEDKIKELKSHINKWNLYSVEDQMKRYNISKEEAEIKIKKIKNVNVFSIEWQMDRFGISKDDALLKVENIKNKLKDVQSKMNEFDFNSMTPSKKEHWIKKGYSEEDAIEKSNINIKQATSNLIKVNKDRLINPDRYIGMFNTSIEYYLKKGYSESESKKLLKERQTTFSLDICMEKYGLENGLQRWKERQDKWIKNLDGKITNDMRDSVSFEHFLKKNNYDEYLAMIEYRLVFEKRYLSSKIGMASKASMKIFNKLIKWCINNGFDYYCGTDNKKEYYLIDDDKKIYAYDFTIPSMNLIFEFHGKFWHTKFANSNEINELGVSLSESYKKDKIKKELASRRGFKLVELWEEDGIEINIKKVFNIVEK